MAGARSRGQEPVRHDMLILLKAMRGQMTERDKAMIGFSRETIGIATRMIEANPAMERAILDLAESAYMDGLDANT